MLLAAGASLQADTLHLKGGRTMQVDSCSRSGSELICRRAGGTIGIPVDQVERLERDAAAVPSPARPERSRRTSSQLPAPAPMPPQGVPLTGASPEPEAVRARIDELSRQIGTPGGDGPGPRHELAVYHAYLANLEALAGRFPKAEEGYRLALGHEPSLLVARLNLAATLITLDKHDEAAGLLSHALSEQPDNARALALQGELLAQTGRLEEAIPIWEKAMQIDPDGPLAGRLDKARRLLQAEQGFHRSEAGHFALKFDGGEASPELAAEILRYLELTHADLCSRLSLYPDSTVQVTLYSREAFLEATDSPRWVGGLFDGQMRIPIGGLSHLTPQLRRVLSHELAHYFVATKTSGHAPQWVQEGIAQIVEGKTASGQKPALRQALDVLGPASAGEFSYPRALSQVEFLVDSWSWSQMQDLLDSLGQGNDIDVAMRQATGLTYAEFLLAWGDWLAR